MDSIEKDVSYSCDIIERKETPWNYDKIYSSANDSIDYIMPLLNVEKKDILTVLGSSDQAFHFYDNGASNVDLYDINKLTIYYYYLRTWIIKYNNSFYPEYTKVKNLNEYLEIILNKVKPLNNKEEAAYKYWKKLISRTNRSIESNLFHRDYCYPGNEIYDLDNLKERIPQEANFYNINLAGNVNLIKKYDVIFISNIIEWVLEDKWDIEKLVNNLYKLLKENGKVVCTKFALSGAGANELKYFKSCFNYYPLADYFSDDIGKWTPGYVYQKKVKR